jgi:hypothetical protein
MNIHPLFSGFKGEDAFAVGGALGFDVHVETAVGVLPADVPAALLCRMGDAGDLAGFLPAGGWEAPGVHCLLFVKPRSATAVAMWRAGLGEVPPVHADDLAVDAFANLMKTKLWVSRGLGRDGWDDPARCSVETLAALLARQLYKGDPVDLANLAMMVHARGGRSDVVAAAARGALECEA